MARRNSGTYGGSAALYPIRSSAADKLEIAQERLAEDRLWLEAAQENGDESSLVNARKAVRRGQQHLEVLRLAVKLGRDVREQGQGLVIVTEEALCSR